MARNIVGAVVRGGDFFGRDEFIEQLWEKLETTNVLLAAPRRFGKTSVMCCLLDHPKPDYKVVHIDLEPVAEPVDFVVLLLDKIRQDEKLLNFVRQGIEGIRKILPEVGITIEGVDFKIRLKEELKKSWQDVGGEILRKLETLDDKLVLIFDEFAVMIENFLDDRLKENEVREFLQWFRSLRIDPGTTKCRFVIGSSISIDHHLSKLGVIATIGDFEKMVLPEFDDKTAKLFVDELFKGKKVTISKTARKKVLELVGPPTPYFIQILVSEVIKKFAGKRIRVTPKDVESIYDDAVLGVSCKTYFQHYYDRLKHYDIKSERAAKALLKNLALANDVKRSELYQQYLRETQQQSDADGFNNLMSDLENDFYIKYLPDKESYVFFSKILRDWWRRYYSL